MEPDDTPEDWGKWLIHGPQGSGKTTLASTIAELGPTLFLDLTGEKGIRSFKGAPYAKHIEVTRPPSITALDDIYWWLAGGNHPYTAVVIDSLTSVQKMAMRFMLGHSETAVREIKQGTAPADMRTWGQTLDIMVDTATFWFGLADGNRPKPMHVVMTAQTKVTDGDEDSPGTRRTPDVQKGALSIVLASPDYIVYTDLEENLEALSDETLPPVNHIVRFGQNLEYRTKARLPFRLRGRIPPVLGREKPVSLLSLSRVLGIGGVPAAPAAKKQPVATVAAGATESGDKA
jgi:energy-coupling factor transporter ATP-binding protein EcfA2